jgi:hypothetical protein
MSVETSSDRASSEATKREVVPLRKRVARELREHPIGYTLLGCLLVLGPLLAPLLFPQAPPAAAAAGGLAVGLFAAISSAPQRFL